MRAMVFEGVGLPLRAAEVRGFGPAPAPRSPSLFIEPDDGRAVILQAIASARRQIRIGICNLSDRIVGQALTEHAFYDKDSGQLLSGSFMDYAFPRADIVPSVKFDMHNSLCTTNPLGVKGAGEAGAIGAPPSVVNAIVDAIHPHTGVKHMDMPVTAASLWKAIEPNRGTKAA